MLTVVLLKLRLIGSEQHTHTHNARLKSVPTNVRACGRANLLDHTFSPPCWQATIDIRCFSKTKYPPGIGRSIDFLKMSRPDFLKNKELGRSICAAGQLCLCVCAFD